MNNVIFVTERNGFENLLNTSGCLSLGIVLSRDNIFEKLATGDKIKEHIMALKLVINQKGVGQ